VRAAGRYARSGKRPREGTLRRLVRSRIVLLGLGILLGLLGALVWQNLMPDRRELTSPVAPVLAASDPLFFQTMNGLFGSNVSEGNRIETLRNGDAIFPAMLEAIRNAERSVTFETYIYWRGAIAEEFADALADRARAGVEVKVLLDWQGSVPMDHAIKEAMEAAGVQIVRFRPVHWYTLDKINNRTHRKLLVVDGRVGFTGGVGIGDEWLGDARHPGEWRENHYRVTGPAVSGLQEAFADNWVEATGEVLKGEGFFPPLEPQADGVRAHMVKSSAGGRNALHLMMMAAIASAERHVRVGTPYFVPDEVAKFQLIEARRRGIEVDVLVPGAHMSKAFVRGASRHFWGDLLEAGVRIHEFQPTFFHPKMVIVDDAWVTVGSANFDERAFRLNDEANLAVFDAAFAREQAAIYDDDLARARQVTLAEWESRPMRQRIADWAFSWFRAQL
jgi:cardiolipin synthase A/B